MTAPYVPVIMCGGSGTRLWPLSRQDLPKPFVTLPGRASTLIDNTYARLRADASAADSSAPVPTAVVTVTSAKYAFLCRRHYQQSGPDAPHFIITEPIGRNTAPAIATAAHWVAQRFGADAQLAAMPADHDIADAAAFAAALAATTAAAADNAGGIVLIGIPPTHPATGYGYIEYEAGDGEGNDKTAAKVIRFTEKPDTERAQEFIRQGNFFWNAGIFCATAGNALALTTEHCPDIAAQLPHLFAGDTAAGNDNTTELTPRAEIYQKLPAISFDYAVMEKTDKVRVISGGNLGWHDVGAWSAVAPSLPADESGNRTEGEATLHHCRNTMAISPHRLTVGIGLENLHIIDTPDALLVSRAGSTADASATDASTADASATLAQVYKTLLAAGEPAAQTPVTVKKPWGSYTVIAEGGNYKIKRIDVDPGAQLSLQSHRHRSEHWVTVAGTMTVTIADNTYDMPVNEACFIPQQSKHRMANRGQVPAAVIEVQIGTYLGEDDITRYADIYGRTP